MSGFYKSTEHFFFLRCCVFSKNNSFHLPWFIAILDFVYSICSPFTAYNKERGLERSIWESQEGDFHLSLEETEGMTPAPTKPKERSLGGSLTRGPLNCPKALPIPDDCLYKSLALCITHAQPLEVTLLSRHWHRNKPVFSEPWLSALCLFPCGVQFP